MLIITSAIFFATCFAFSQGNGNNNNDLGGVTFIENNGQLIDTDGNPRPDILYYTSAGGANVYFTKDAACYVWSRIDTNNSLPDTLYRVDMQLLGTNPMVQVTGVDPTQGFNNFYLSHIPNGILNVPSYKKLQYKDIYPNIDLVFIDDGRGLNYDFIVHPGGDPDDIRFKHIGADKVIVNQKGELCVKTRFGLAEHERPVLCKDYRACQQPTHAVFIKKGEIISIEITSPVRPKPNVDLVISIAPIGPPIPFPIPGQFPNLSWSTYYGGTDLDQAISITSDNSGNIYVAGSSKSNNFPITTGTNPGAGTFNIFVIKFRPNNNMVHWATLYGSTGTDFALSIVFDNIGSIFITGVTSGGTFPTQPETGCSYYDSLPNGMADAYILKLDIVNGSSSWATYYGGGNDDNSNNISTDIAGNVYITGSTVSSNFPTLDPGGSAYYDNTLGGGFLTPDAFIVKFDNQGCRIWATYLGGGVLDVAVSSVIDNSGNLYVFGTTDSSPGNNQCGIPTNNGFPLCDPGGTAYFQNTLGGNRDIFISKFNSSGIIQWSTYYGGVGQDSPNNNGVAIDASGNIYLAGTTMSSDFPTLDPGGDTYFDNTLGGTQDAFIIKFSDQDEQLWATYYGGSDIETGGDVSIDNSGNVFLYGESTSADLPVKNLPFSFFQSTNAGLSDAFIVEFNSSGERLWATYFGGDDNDYAFAIEVIGAPAAGGSVYIIGETFSSNTTFPLKDPGGLAYFQPTITLSEAFIARFHFACQICLRTAGTSEFEAADMLNIAESKLNIYPNPAYNHLNVDFYLEDNKQVNIMLYNTIGVKVYTNTINGSSGSNSCKLDISSLPKQMYFMRIILDNEIITKKVFLN